MSPYGRSDSDRGFWEFDSSHSTMEVEETVKVIPFEWTWKESLLTIPLSLIVIGTIIGNFLVLLSFFTKPNSLRLPTHFLIANLSLADFLVGVFVMPFLATLQITGRWYFGITYCEAWTVIHFWLCSASILSTCAVCIERYIGVEYPLDHKLIMRRGRIWGMITGVWILAGCLTLSSIYIWPEPKTGQPYVCEINQQIGHVIVAVVGILYIPALIMIILYAKIFIIASRHLNFMKHNSTCGLNYHDDSKISSSDGKSTSGGVARFFKVKLNSISENEPSTSDVIVSTSSPRGSSEDLEKDISPEKQNQRYQKKDSQVSAASTAYSSASSTSAFVAKKSARKKQFNLARRLALLVTVLLASYLPFFTLYMVMAFHPNSINPNVFMAFGWIRYFNSCLNPFIYAFAVPAYREAMTQTILKAYKRICGSH